MDRMTISGALWLTSPLRALRAYWPALLLPLVAVDTLGVTHGRWPEPLVIVAITLATVAPRESAKIAPLAFFAYGAYGIFLTHSLLVFETSSAFYGLVNMAPDTNGAYPAFRQAGPSPLRQRQPPCPRRPRLPERVREPVRHERRAENKAASEQVRCPGIQGRSGRKFTSSGGVLADGRAPPESVLETLLRI
jgi:hypothetical protein